MVEISIIIPVYNQFSFTRDCLMSIFEMTKGYDYELIVVANGCTDQTEENLLKLQKEHNNLIFYSYSSPLGYTEATNRGAKMAEGEYLVFLNNDTKILAPTWLSILREPFKDEKVAITGPLRSFSQDVDSDFLIFFCVMVRKNLFDKYGPLDTIFSPGYGEDIDFCMKIKESGYKILQVPPDPLQVKSGMVIGNFPIWHAGEATVHFIPNWNDITKRNRDILRKRFL